MADYLDKQENGFIEYANLKTVIHERFDAYNPAKPVIAAAQEAVYVLPQLGLGDTFEGLAHVLDSQGKLNADVIFKECDKDKSWLLSVKEIEWLVQKYLKFEMTPPEVKQMDDHIHKKYNRGDLKRDEFMELLTEEKVSTDYNEG